jgi:hypothetical protein
LDYRHLFFNFTIFSIFVLTIPTHLSSSLLPHLSLPFLTSAFDIKPSLEFCEEKLVWTFPMSRLVLSMCWNRSNAKYPQCALGHGVKNKRAAEFVVDDMIEDISTAIGDDR